MTRSRFIFLVGPSGSGKSVLAVMVSEATSYELFDTDQEVLDASGYDSIAEIFDRHGEEDFRRREAECIEELSQRDGSFIVATGGGLPAIPGMAERLRSLGVSVYLSADLDELWDRLSENEGELAKRPLLRDGGKEQLRRLVLARKDAYESSTETINTDALFVKEVSAKLTALIRERHGEEGSEWVTVTGALP
jgi:shikimate kinase